MVFFRLQLSQKFWFLVSTVFVAFAFNLKWPLIWWTWGRKLTIFLFMTRYCSSQTRLAVSSSKNWTNPKPPLKMHWKVLSFLVKILAKNVTFYLRRTCSTGPKWNSKYFLSSSLVLFPQVGGMPPTKIVFKASSISENKVKCIPRLLLFLIAKVVKTGSWKGQRKLWKAV